MSSSINKSRGLGLLMLLTPWLGASAAWAQASSEPAASEGAAAVADAEARRIDVLEYLIEGNTVLPAAEIEAAVQPYLGPQRSVADVSKAREALEQAYRKKGFQTVGVEIPEQDVRSGIVRLNVVELSVGRLRV